MCLAPRYISGMIARPSSPCRKTASLPDTPCALNTAEAIVTKPTVSSAFFINRLNPGSIALIALVARIAGGVDHLTNRENASRSLCVRRFQRRLRGVAHRGRKLDPVPFVHGTVA